MRGESKALMHLKQACRLYRTLGLAGVMQMPATYCVQHCFAEQWGAEQSSCADIQGFC